MSCNWTAITKEIPKLIKLHIHTRNKLGSKFKTRFVIILIISTKNVNTDR